MSYILKTHYNHRVIKYVIFSSSVLLTCLIGVLYKSAH
ncbi:hypothetical protein GGQ73_002210 [Rhizobium skierniewicense]|uniref:Uncharacterized protein n=1 Tax=Rhizobium skierniewicense TaxID=984260 RepID=A0A7W6C5R9_9HYPH|nr:hypothetical protein [Rhizobium skierniewicense]